MIIVDAMNLGYLLLSHPSFSEDVREMARVDDERCAPPLWRSELRNTFMQHVRATDPDIPASDLTLSGAVERMRAAEALIGERTFDVKSEPVLRLADGSGYTAYDCEYVALAQRLRNRIDGAATGRADAPAQKWLRPHARAAGAPGSVGRTQRPDGRN